MKHAVEMLYLVLALSILQLLPELGCLMCAVHELALLADTSPPLLSQVSDRLCSSLSQLVTLLFQSLHPSYMHFSTLSMAFTLSKRSPSHSHIPW